MASRSTTKLPAPATSANPPPTSRKPAQSSATNPASNSPKASPVSSNTFEGQPKKRLKINRQARQARQVFLVFFKPQPWRAWRAWRLIRRGYRGRSVEMSAEMSGGRGAGKRGVSPVPGGGSVSSDAWRAWGQRRGAGRSGGGIRASNIPGGAGGPPLSANRRKISSLGP